MPTINLDAISKKCRQWGETSVGKARMKEVLINASRNGQKLSGCGDEIVTYSVMGNLVDELIFTIRMTAASYDLANSVMKHFDSLTYWFQDNKDGSFTFLIFFSDDLSRESLDADYYTGEGIQNIVALFNNGYVASAPKYGWWYNHKPTGSYAPFASGYDNTDAFVISRQGRPSLQFMQQAINDFCKKYAGQYNFVVELNDIYDGNYAGSLNGIITKL